MAITRAQQVRQMLEKGGGADRIPTEFEKFLFQKQLQLLQEFENYKDKKPIEKRQNEFFEMRTGTGKGPTLEAKEGGSTKKIKGQEHMLAYITPGEAKTLENLGGQKTMTPEGIPAYPPPGKGASTGIGGSGRGTGGDQTGGGGNNKDDDKGNDYDDRRSEAARDIIAMQKAFGVDPDGLGKGLTKSQKRAREAMAAQRAGFKDTIKEQKGGGFSIFDLTPTGIIKNIAKSFSNSPFAIKNNLMQRQNYLSYLSRTKPQAFLDLTESLEDQGLATIDESSVANPNKRVGASAFSVKDYIDLNPEKAGSPDVKDAFGEGYQEYLDRFDPKDDFGDRGGGSFTDPCKGPNPPAYCFIGTNAPATEEEGFDFSRLLAEGGMPMDAPYVGGGVMDAAGRQQYFLGKLVKGAKRAVRGVTRSLKKVAKSPIGKAALLGVGGGLMGIGPFSGLATAKGLGFKNFMLNNILGTPLGDITGTRTGGLFNFIKDNPILAIGGASALAGLLTPKEEDDEEDVGPDINFAEIINNPYAYTLPRQMAEGGRIGYSDGTIEGGAMMSEKEMKKLAKSPLYKGFKKMYEIDPSMARDNDSYKEKLKIFEELYDKGFQKGGDVEPVAKKTMPLLDMGGKEMDLRAEGGFVPIGRMEKADDVPARLSKNEFVFTADAVRNAGEGDVDKGAEVMYNMMKNLESGGEVSEESQGLSGAREMFQTSKRLEEVL